MDFVKKGIRVVVAGGLGGLANSLLLWLCGVLGITPALLFRGRLRKRRRSQPGWPPFFVRNSIWIE